MKTVNQKAAEVAMIMANTNPVEGLSIYWLISKKQVEYMLTDIAALPASVEHPHLQRAQYQEEVLPVLCLEQYYGLEELAQNSNYKYIVTKYPAPDGNLVKVILRISHPVRVRSLNFDATQTQQPALKNNATDILGAFTLTDDQLVVIPNIAAILNKV